MGEEGFFFRGGGVGGEGGREEEVHRLWQIEVETPVYREYFFPLFINRCKYHEYRKGDSSMIAYFFPVFICVLL